MVVYVLLCIKCDFFYNFVMHCYPKVFLNMSSETPHYLYECFFLVKIMNFSFLLAKITNFYCMFILN